MKASERYGTFASDIQAKLTTCVLCGTRGFRNEEMDMKTIQGGPQPYSVSVDVLVGPCCADLVDTAMTDDVLNRLGLYLGKRAIDVVAVAVKKERAAQDAIKAEQLKGMDAEEQKILDGPGPEKEKDVQESNE